MKQIISMLKTEIFTQYSHINDLVKKVTISQESYIKDRSNEALYNTWSEDVQKLQKAESDMRYLRSAYSTLCNACEVEPMSVEEIVADKEAKKAKKESRQSTPKSDVAVKKES